MLHYFRHHAVRKSLWMIILLASLVTQTQNMFACDLMDTGAQSSCCCEANMGKGCAMGGGCSTSDDGVFSGCCQTSTVIDSGLVDEVIGDSHQHKIVSLDAPQFTSIFILFSDLFLPVTDFKTTFAYHKSTLPKFVTGSSTYRTTQRFRI